MSNTWKPGGKTTSFSHFWNQHVGEEIFRKLYVHTRKPIPEHYNSRDNVHMDKYARQSVIAGETLNAKLMKDSCETHMSGEILFPGMFGIVDVMKEGVSPTKEQLVK